MAKISEKALAAMPETKGAVVPIGKPRLKRQVTRPLLKQKVGQEVWVKFMSKIFLSEKITTGDKVNDAKLPPNMAHVLDLWHGVPWEHTYIVPAVLKSELERQYPDHSYVGLCFQIQKLGPDTEGGKRYNNFTVAETYEPEMPEDAA